MLTSRVCEGAIGKVPQDRLMKMRWVLTFKSTDDPGTLKAKARLVVLGFTDPDVGLVNVRSPTLSRRGRQLMLQATSLNNWGFLKAMQKLLSCKVVLRKVSGTSTADQSRS